MAETLVTDPLAVATQGLLSGSPFTIAIQGFIVKIVEEPVPEPDVGITPEKSGGGVPAVEEELPKKKLIKVYVYKNGREFWQTKEVVDVNVRISDIDIFIDNSNPNKPIIEVKIPE